MSMPSPPSSIPADTAVSAPAASAADAPGLTRLGAARLDMIDTLRGLVIALMVLDHVRDFFHRQALQFSPTDLDQTTPALFATRWVTHLCAPSFVFLAGVSIYLQGVGGKSRAELSRFTLSRGAWLVLLELTVVGFGFQFLWPFVFLQVIWAIGFSMIAMSALLWLPRQAVLALGALIVAGHGFLAGFDAQSLGAWAPLWTVLMRPGPLPGIESFVAYPALPWTGVMLIGYGLGPMFLLEAGRRRRAIAALALALLATFAILRGVLAFGDPRPWRRMADPLFDAMSFINVSKYPPSLQYVLATLGVSLLLMLALERLRGPLRPVLLAYGRTPLFTYLLHIYLAHGLAVAIGVAGGIPASAFPGIIGNGQRLLEAGWGMGLPAVFGMWLLVLAILYPLSRWFAGVKRRHRDRWLSYL
ncbi:DUF1624 domain-containing protein [Lysobacter sp. TAB13]|uniref:DUF1624 domain-containing protein n=1 Tax=Lysobacter sp. TAB13 TaxID=3233065 RepID=UPI003F9A0EAB